MPGVLDSAHRSVAGGRVPGRRHGRSAPQRGVLSHLDHQGPWPRLAARISGIIFRARRWTSSRERSGSKAPAPASSPRAHRARLPSAAVPKRFGVAAPMPCSSAEPTRSRRLTYTGFNLLRLMDPAPCRPFDRSRAGMNIGEGAGILVLERLDRARARGARIYAELAGHAVACEAFHPTAPEPEGRPVAAIVTLALQDAGINVDEVAARQRARYGHASERRRRGARLPARVRRPRGADTGHVDQVDDRALSRCERRGRGGGAGADHRPRRDPADHSSLRGRRRVPPRHRRQRSARRSACAAASRRRSVSAATTRPS